MAEVAIIIDKIDPAQLPPPGTIESETGSAGPLSAFGIAKRPTFRKMAKS